MIPSKFLRLIISKNHKLSLYKYSWDKTLTNDIFKISFVDGNQKMTLKQVFKEGYNIGNCLLTSFYVSQAFEYCKICTGKVEILKGTKNSPNGDHVWIETDDEILDTTLMIKIPKEDKLAKYYLLESTLSKDIKIGELSYDGAIYDKIISPEGYYEKLYKVK